MNTLLVYAHPEPSSFHAAMRDRIAKDVRVVDLCAMRWKAAADWDDFVDRDLPRQYGPAQKEASTRGGFSLDIREQQEHLLWCDAVVLQFPLWWFGMPAILKGWLDRVMAAGFAYDGDGRWFEKGPLAPRRAMLAVTTQAPATSFGPKGLNGDIASILAPIHHALRFVGLRPVAPFLAFGVMSASDADRQAHLDAYAARIGSLDRAEILRYPPIDEYDAALVRR